MTKNIIMMDTYKILTSKLFFISILGVAVFCFVSVHQDIPITHLHETTVINMIDLLFCLSMFKKILIIFASIPIVAIFCTDWIYQYIRPVIMRGGIKRYIWTKIFICQLASFFVVFIGMFLFVFVMSCFSPLADSDVNAYVGWEAFESLLLNKQNFLYLFLNIFIFSLGISFWVVLGMTISAYIPNQFVAIISPFIVAYLLEEFTSLMPLSINLFYLTRVQFDTGNGNIITFLYYIFIFELLIILSGFLFSYQVKRRIRNEIV